MTEAGTERALGAAPPAAVGRLSRMGTTTTMNPGACPSSDPVSSATSNLADANAYPWHSDMIMNCVAYAKEAVAAGHPMVGILCEFTPRELILAADAVPVCLCGGSVKTVAAAEQDLPPGLCPLIKSTFGYHVLQSNPFLEMAALIVAETTCDGKKKMYEIMAESRPMYILELPQKPDDPDAFEHWVIELRKFKSLLEQQFSVSITDHAVRSAIEVMNRERALRRQLAELMKRNRPPFTGRRLLSLKSSISGIPSALAELEDILGACREEPDDPKPLDSVRVLMTGTPMVHGAERVLNIIEQNGGLVVCMENCTGLKPILEEVDPHATDPLRALAEKYFHLGCSVMTPNTRRLEILRQLVAEYRPECIVELVWQGCLTYEVEAYHVKRMAETEFRLPYLKIETDYSPSDSPRIQTRVEALFETVRDGR